MFLGLSITQMSNTQPNPTIPINGYISSASPRARQGSWPYLHFSLAKGFVGLGTNSDGLQIANAPQGLLGVC